MMRPLLLAFALLLSSPLYGVVTNVHPLSPVELSPYGGGSFSVVAGNDGWVLVDGHRIDPEGRLVDQNRIPGVFGPAVAWEDGWLLFEQGAGEIIVRRLGRSGAPVVVASFPSRGSLVDVEVGHGQIVLVEEGYDRPGETVTWVTHRTLERITRIQRFAFAEDPALATTGDGFRLVARQPGQSTVLHLWDLDATGKPLRYLQHDPQVRVFSDQLDIVANGNTTLVIVPSFARTRLDVVSPSLDLAGSVFLSDSPEARVTAALPHPQGFFVSYSSRSAPDAEARAKIVSLAGTELADVASDPIAGADALNDLYFVMRPWRDGAVAANDPRTIITTPVRIPRGEYQSFTLLDTVVSDGVTLALFRGDRTMFRRIDLSGSPLDETAIVAPGEVSAIPGGFVFHWRDGERFLMRRLEARGDWIDLEPVELLRASNVISSDISAGTTGLIVAWTKARTLHWRTFDFSGTPDGDVRESELPPYDDLKDYGAWPLVDVHSSGDDHLLVVNHHFECRITCSYPTVPVHALAVDRDGRARGEITTIDPDARADAATALSDGTWLLAVTGHGFVRLASSGEILTAHPFPPGIESVLDLKASGSGWIASDSQGRVYQFDASGVPRTLEWVSIDPDMRTMLGAGDVVVFGRPAPELRTHYVEPRRIFSGVLSSSEGDVSIHLIRAWRAGGVTHAEVEIRNHGAHDATIALQMIPRWNEWDPQVLVFVPAGASRRVYVRPNRQGLYAIEARAELEDHDPSNNIVTITEIEIEQPRRRGLRR